MLCTHLACSIPPAATHRERKREGEIAQEGEREREEGREGERGRVNPTSVLSDLLLFFPSLVTIVITFILCMESFGRQVVVRHRKVEHFNRRYM